jgi:phage tail-like protein
VPDRVILAPAFSFQVKLLLSPISIEGKERDPAREATAEKLVADGAFQECSGLDVEMDVQEYLEGGRNDGVIKRVGRAKYQQLVLKRGMFYNVSQPPAARGEAPPPPTKTVDPQLWKWFQDVVSGKRPVPRYDGIVEVLPRLHDPKAQQETPVARWFFDRGLPAKVVGPQLNARTGEVAIEELHIAHEGLRLVF